MAGSRASAINNLRHSKRTILLFEFCSLCENIHTNLNGYPFSNPEYPGR
ncbi:hypothetical protein EC990672_4019 [Escherichia coli 99.0672]|nr:hypothetical protein ECDEC5A_3455 [Escherichia coli DEC5A]EIN19207.1 hypothetical protein ECFRIK1996_4043 [Escherichia coli FRIK1996]EIN21319.1 hypothetical protein ECFDA505_3942 [Escherichia coli FDA505]EIN37396.1 hypothetical protein ECFRIK1985_4247 [Escherichia coli FRIK1985]EIN58524.1 hypothetical protein ECPA9_4154 [Escherichia coli PA9]EIO48122.1 hypothetical protein ECTW06591_3672 [Escherichia coli TW06591]EIO92996.1 hypothetical protein ECTW09195_4135 [Escherichia coli TW09195]EIP